jgi:hypothetical protein
MPKAKEEEIKQPSKSYVFKTIHNNPNEHFGGLVTRKSIYFDKNCLLVGDENTYKDLKKYIEMGLIEVFENTMKEALMPESSLEPEARLRLLIAKAKDAGIQDFNGKVIDECTPEEIDIALKVAGK